MAVTNIFTSGTLIESAKANQNFTECVLINGSQSASFIPFIPQTGSTATNNSLFVDNTDFSLKLKDNSGNISAIGGDLGEIKQFALSISGAVTKATLQGKGWAICDGTTPLSQGITGATITTTPDLREKFLRHSATETTGGTGGESTHVLTIAEMPAHSHSITVLNGLGPSSSVGQGTGTAATASTGSQGSGTAHENKPPYYDICFFLKVK